MAKKSWSVVTDEGTFSVDLNGSKVSINGAPPQKLNKFARKMHFMDTEYTIPLGNRSATLFIQSMASPILAYNGTDCATGQPWEYQKIPAWGWVFLVLDLVGLLVAGWILVLLALIVTMVIIRSKLNIGIKIVLCILLTGGLYATGIFATAALAPVLY